MPIVTAALRPHADKAVARELRSTVRVDGSLVPTGNIDQFDIFLDTITKLETFRIP